MVYNVCHSQQSDQGLHHLTFSAVWSRSRSTLSFSETIWSGFTLFVIVKSLTASTLFAILSSLNNVYTVCQSRQSNQGLYCLPFSAVWSGTALFAICSSLIRVYTICHSKQSDQHLIRFFTVCHSQQSDRGLHYLPFSVWSGSTVFAILSSLIGVYTICHSQSDQGLQFLPFSAVWSGSTLFVVLSKQYYQALHCLPFLAVWSGLHYLPFSAVWSRSRSTLWFAGTVWSGSTLFTILNSLIRVYTVCLSPQQSDQGLHCLPFFLSIIIMVYNVCHSQQSDQGLHHLTFSAVWSRSRSTLSFSGTIWSGSTLFVILKSLTASTLLAILSSLNNVYTVCQSRQSNQGLYCLPFSAVWSGTALFAICSSLIRVYTICHSQQSDQHLIRFYTVCHSQQSDRGLHYLPFSVWSGSTVFAILSSLIRVYTICRSF